MFDGITSDRISKMTDQEKRWLDNVKKAFYHSDIEMNRGVPEDRCLEEIFKAIDTAKTLRRSLRGESISTKQNSKRFIEFLALEIPSVKSKKPKLELKEVESGQLRQYALGDIIYKIRCKVHENENLNYAENINYHILLNWSKRDTGLIGKIEGGRFVCNGYFLWNRLREILAKFITYIDSAFLLAKEQTFFCTISPKICSIKHSKKLRNNRK